MEEWSKNPLSMRAVIHTVFYTASSYTNKAYLSPCTPVFSISNTMPTPKHNTSQESNPNLSLDRLGHKVYVQFLLQATKLMFSRVSNLVLLIQNQAIRRQFQAKL